MQVSGEYTFDAPQDIVWTALQDPAVLGSVIPGGQGIEEVGPNQYSGVIAVKVGPVQGTFNGKISLSDVTPPQSYTINVEGSGPQGHLTGQGGIQLTPQGERTHMAYQGNAKVGGRIATVGQRLIDVSAKSIIRQSLEGLNEYLKVEVQRQALTQAAEAAPSSKAAVADTVDEVPTAPPMGIIDDVPPAPAASSAAPQNLPTYTPPSQTNMALAVAGDVFREFVPARYRPVVLGAGAVVLLLALRRIFK